MFGLYVVTSKCASHRSRAHLFDINLKKCSEHGAFFAVLSFDFQMCIAPQRGAIFDLTFTQMALHPPL
jgi:hypothetical protein